MARLGFRTLGPRNIPQASWVCSFEPRSAHDAVVITSETNCGVTREVCLGKEGKVDKLLQKW